MLCHVQGGKPELVMLLGLFSSGINASSPEVFHTRS